MAEESGERPKRPIGLGSKRTKEETNGSGGDAPERPGLYFEVSEDGGQLEELKAMLETAEAVSDDPEKAIPLLRGVIHECDLVVRAHHEAGASVQMELNQAFWVLYGDALLLLGQVEFREQAAEVAEFVREAIERYESALECGDGDVLVKMATAKALLFAVDEDSKLDKEFMIDAFSSGKHVEKLVSGLIEAANDCEDSEKAFVILSAVKEKIMEHFDDPNLSLIVLKYANALSEAQLEPYLEDDDPVDEAGLYEIEQLLSKASDNCSAIESSESFFLQGEANMLIGSIFELLQNGHEASGHYGRACRLFRSAKAAGHELPGGIEAFLEEMKDQ